MSSGYAGDSKMPSPRWTVKKRKFSLRRFWNKLNDSEYDDYSYENVPTTNYPFMNSYSGWNIRMHSANGGHIVEVWKSSTTLDYGESSDRKHHLYVVSSEQNIVEELPKILTEIYLKDE